MAGTGARNVKVVCRCARGPAVVQSRHGSQGPRRGRPPDRRRDAARDEGRRAPKENPVYQVGQKSFVFFRNPRPDAFDPETGERYDDVIVIWVATRGRQAGAGAGPGLAVLHDAALRRPPSVLVRGSRIGEIDLDELTELIQDAWLSRASRRRGETWLAQR